MSKYESRKEIAEKADYEGGVLELVFGYGLWLDELPEDDIELKEALEEVLKAKDAIERFEDLIMDALED